MKTETSINELDKIAGGRLDDSQVHDAVLAMAQAHIKAKRMYDAGKREESMEYISKCREIFVEFGGLYPKPEYEGYTSANSSILAELSTIRF